MRRLIAAAALTAVGVALTAGTAFAHSRPCPTTSTTSPTVSTPSTVPSTSTTVESTPTTLAPVDRRAVTAPPATYQTVTKAAPAPAPTAAAPAELAFTGVDSTLVFLAGMLLVAAGLGLTVAARRRLRS